MKRKLMFIMTLLIAMSLTGYAQSKLTDAQKKEVKAKFEEYRKELNLTEEQAVKMEEINAAYFEGLAGLKKSPGSRMSKYRQLKSLTSARDEKAQKVLSQEQYKRYKEQQKELKDAFRSNRR